ncbi:MAG: hypothetical protein CL928_18775, partial [Deltaproteobacteria bacterium]|nr:hypothetical protein [Deltaproteobacteria bacterium]
MSARHRPVTGQDARRGVRRPTAMVGSVALVLLGVLVTLGGMRWHQGTTHSLSTESTDVRRSSASEGVEARWLSTIRERIENTNYRFRQASDHSDQYLAYNPRQEYRATLDADGLALRRLQDGDDADTEPALSIRLARWGDRNDPTPVHRRPPELGPCRSPDRV